MIACSGAKSDKPPPLPQQLTDRCYTAQRVLQAQNASTDHVPMALKWRQGDGVTTITEDQLGKRLRAGRAGTQTWVLARGGSGKSRLVGAVQAANCGQVPVIRIDAALDLRPKMTVATDEKPALGQVLLEQLGGQPEDDAIEVLQAKLGGQPWLLILDGTDELSQADRRAMGKDLAWLAKSGATMPHFVRFERPGFTLGMRAMQPDAVAELPELTCEQADAVWQRRTGGGSAYQAALAWRAKLNLDRKRPDGEGCRYVFMPTFRDAETLADLAVDAGKGMDDLPATPNRADVFASWTGHRVRGVATSTDAALGWLDRMIALGVADATEPDFVLTLDRCQNAKPPGGVTAEEACTALMGSTIVKAGPSKHIWLPRNQTLTDLLLARWLVAKHSECETLAGATAELASLELTAMVIAQTGGRRCLSPIVAALCSRGTQVEDIAKFTDEALSRDSDFVGVVQRGAEKASGACERAVFASLGRPSP